MACNNCILPGSASQGPSSALQHFASIVSSQPGPHKRPHIIGVAAPNNFSLFLRPCPSTT